MSKEFVSAKQDATDVISKIPGKTTGIIESALTDPSFNRDFTLATQWRGNSPSLPEFTINDTDKFQISDRTRHQSDNTNPSAGVKFRNVDASPEFFKTTQEAFRESFGKLNPETQAKLRDLQVITATQAHKGLPGVPKDIPAVTPDMAEKRGNLMVFSEVGIKKDKAPVKDVMNHEIFHAVDNTTKASEDPELRKAIDAGIRRLPAKEQKEIAVHGKEQTEQRYAEFSADMMAMTMGSKKENLAYITHLTNPYNNFREARELIKRKYLQ